MRFFTFAKDSGCRVTEHESNFIMSRIMQTNHATQIGCMYLDKNDIVGYHQAVVPQLLLVISGQGLVRGERGEYVEVRSGDAVFWEQNEWHETKTDNGLTAIVIEGTDLDPAKCMPAK
ncbi:cupin [Lentibacillus saliphilus]|uniref:cupin n=1 Tax=Lentibacillus saliphilus TaxID=2737028 RepID=UPI001C30DB18|nr:cupin [Lentibacillus saliphilus]